MTPKWTPATRELAGYLGADDHGLRSLVETHESLQAEYKARIAELEAENARLLAKLKNCKKELGKLFDFAMDAERQYEELSDAYQVKP